MTRSHHKPVDPEVMEELPTWFTNPWKTWRYWPKNHPIAQPMVDAAKALDWVAMHREAQALWTYPVGSPEREDLAIALHICTWHLNRQGKRDTYAGSRVHA